MKKTITLIIVIISSIVITYSQSWLGNHTSIVLPNRPSNVKITDIIGANGSNGIGLSGIPNAGKIKSLRDFYHMEIDYNYSYFPNQGTLNANTCPCSNTWCSVEPCITLLTGSNSAFNSKKGFYCAWNTPSFGFTEVYSTLESLFPYKPSLAPTSCAVGSDIDRSWPNKWYSLSEWNGLGGIDTTFRNYLIPFLETYCPTDSSRPCLIDVLEIGNEPWGAGYPGRDGYKLMLESAVNTFQSYYGSTASAGWRMKLSTAALIADDATPSWFGATEMYVGDMIPTSVFPYIDYLNIHNYAFNMTGTPGYNNKSPEHANGGFLTFKNMIDWKNNNMPNAKVNVTEFGWNAQNACPNENSFGEVGQAIYTMRAFLLANRYDIHRAFVYAFEDSGEYPFYCNVGLYDNLPSGDARKVMESIIKLQNSNLKNNRFLKAIHEGTVIGSDTLYTYIYGDSVGMPTHLVTWNAASVTYEDTNYPSVSSSYANISLPDTSLKVESGSNYYYLSWDNTQDNTVSSSGTNNVNISGISNTNVNIKHSVVPIVIPIKPSTCRYDINGTLLNCNASASSLNEITQNELILYPNPTKDIVHIQIMNHENQELKLILTDILGKTISEDIIYVNHSNYAQQMVVSTLQPSNYFVSIIDKSGAKVTKQFVHIGN